MYTLKDLHDKNLKELKEIGWQLKVMPEGDRRLRRNWIRAIADATLPLLQLLKAPAAETVNSSPTINERAIEVQAQGLPIEMTETQSGKDLQQLPYSVQEPIETPPGVEWVDTEPPDPNDYEFREEYVERYKEWAASAIQVEARASETPPGVENFTEADRPPNRGDNGRDRLEFEAELSQGAIGSCASPATFSPRFLATYPPYFGEVHYKAEATGQLNLLEPETDDDPPDFDDFESLDAFNEAMARWDAENAEALAVGMDSMCEWAPCPHEWYEPEPENLPLKASSMRELSPVAIECSSTATNFSIPTFDAWCDRANRQTDSDEPPDTGNFAKLPGPKPPKFPPRAIGQTQISRNYPETIPKLSQSYFIASPLVAVVS